MVDLASLILDVPDFPRPGVTFKDVTPLLASAQGLAAAVDALVALAPDGVDVVVGLEARGFLFGPPVALALGVGFAPIRKPGKLPRESIEVSYALEYGEETLALHTDAVAPGDRVLVVDDVLATGGTAVAAAGLVRRLGADVVGIAVLLELSFLSGRALLAEHGLDQVSAVLTSGAS
jgi:adenine phosphoribosyltransferase